MSDGPNDERIDELIALAALGELTDAEQLELDAALAGDAELSADVDAALDIAATLQRVHAEAPPEALRASVLDSIARVAQDGIDASPTGAGAPPASPGTDPATDDHLVVPIRSARRLRRWQPLLAAAAAVLLVVGGVLIGGRSTSAPSSFDAVVEAPDAQIRSLDGDLDGSLRVIWSADEDAFVLDGANLPVLDAASTYQLWLVDEGGGATSVGLFRPTGDGRVMQRFDDLDPSGFVVGVTIEPVGGSSSPTLPIVASA